MDRLEQQAQLLGRIETLAHNPARRDPVTILAEIRALIAAHYDVPQWREACSGP